MIMATERDLDAKLEWTPEANSASNVEPILSFPQATASERFLGQGYRRGDELLTSVCARKEQPCFRIE